MKVVVLNHLSLDGVIQSPARLDEDTRGGFSHGGWAVAGSDEAVAKWVGPVGAGGPGAMLMGRRSYEGMLGHWNQAGGPFKDALNAATKYVASRSASTHLDWPNSTLLTGDVPEAVARLKRNQEGDLLIMGSGALIQSLVPYNVIDEFRLVIHPLLLGGGVRLFPDDGEAHQLELVDTTQTPKGAILATYRTARTVEGKVPDDAMSAAAERRARFGAMLDRPPDHAMLARLRKVGAALDELDREQAASPADNSADETPQDSSITLPNDPEPGNT